MPDVGIELRAACMPSELASDRATAPGRLMLGSPLEYGHKTCTIFLRYGEKNKMYNLWKPDLAQFVIGWFACLFSSTELKAHR